MPQSMSRVIARSRSPSSRKPSRGSHHVRAPMSHAIDPGSQLVLEGRQTQEEVLRLLEPRSSLADHAARFLRVRRGPGACRRLHIRPRGHSVTRSSDRCPGRSGRAESAGTRGSTPAEPNSCRDNPSSDSVRKISWVTSAWFCVPVVVYRSHEMPSFSPALDELRVVFLRYRARRRFLFLGTDRYWRTMLVTSRHHQHFIAEHPLNRAKMSAGKYAPAMCPRCRRAICVGPGDANMYAFSQVRLLQVVPRSRLQRQRGQCSMCTG